MNPTNLIRVKAIISALVLCFAMNFIIAKEPAVLGPGSKLPQIKCKSGDVFYNVVIRSIESDAIRILHRDGLSSIEINQLPNDLQISLRPSATVPKVEKPTIHSFSWKPSSAEDVADCAVFISNMKDGQKQGSGTGFVCFENGQFYIYTNAHVLEGADSVEITDRSGNKYDDISSLETLAKPHGQFRISETHMYGGDVARFILSTPRAKALVICDEANNPVKSDMEIMIRGDTGGRGEITFRKGKITSFDEHCLQHTAATEPGNSGSAVVETSTWQVIGLDTYGVPIERNPEAAVWSSKKQAVGNTVNYAIRASALKKWSPKTTLKEFNSSIERMQEIEEYIHVLGLLDALEPSSSGLFPSGKMLVRGDIDVAYILRHYKTNRLVLRLLQFDRFVKDRPRMSAADLDKTYFQCYKDCMNIVNNRRGAITSASWPYYYERKIANRFYIQIMNHYIAELGHIARWHEKQLGVGAKTHYGHRPRIRGFVIKEK